MAGNATLTLTTNGKDSVEYELWIQSFNTSTQNEFMSQQVKQGVNWIPIRRAEMFANFNAVWPVLGSAGSTTLVKGYENIDPRDGYAKMLAFQEAIRAHMNAISTGATSLPMKLNYYNNSNKNDYNTLISSQPLSALVYDGWVQSIEKPYLRFQSNYVTSYTMNILTTNVSNTALTTVGPAITYAPPTTATQRNYPVGANGWWNISYLASQSDSISINSVPSSNKG